MAPVKRQGSPWCSPDRQQRGGQKKRQSHPPLPNLLGRTGSLLVEEKHCYYLWVPCHLQARGILLTTAEQPGATKCPYTAPVPFGSSILLVVPEPTQPTELCTKGEGSCGFNILLEEKAVMETAQSPTYLLFIQGLIAPHTKGIGNSVQFSLLPEGLKPAPGAVPHSPGISPSERGHHPI